MTTIARLFLRPLSSRAFRRGFALAVAAATLTACPKDESSPADEAEGETMVMSTGEAETESGDPASAWAGCEADCQRSLDCGFRDNCTDACTHLDDLEAGCAAAFDAWLGCAGDVGCDGDESATCSAESDAVDAACVPTDAQRATCEAYCNQLESCELLEPFGETVQECVGTCNVEQATTPGACGETFDAYQSCVASSSCAQITGEEDDPCADLSAQLDTCIE